MTTSVKQWQHLWNNDNICETMTTSVKQWQHLWNNDNICETMTTVKQWQLLRDNCFETWHVCHGSNCLTAFFWHGVAWLPFFRWWKINENHLIIYFPQVFWSLWPFWPFKIGSQMAQSSQLRQSHRSHVGRGPFAHRCTLGTGWHRAAASALWSANGHTNATRRSRHVWPLFFFYFFWFELRNWWYFNWCCFDVASFDRFFKWMFFNWTGRITFWIGTTISMRLPCTWLQPSVTKGWWRWRQFVQLFGPTCQFWVTFFQRF